MPRKTKTLLINDDLVYNHPKKAKKLLKKLQKEANKGMKVLTFLLNQGNHVKKSKT